MASSSSSSSGVSTRGRGPLCSSIATEASLELRCSLGSGSIIQCSNFASIQTLAISTLHDVTILSASFIDMKRFNFQQLTTLLCYPRKHIHVLFQPTIVNVWCCKCIAPVITLEPTVSCVSAPVSRQTSAFAPQVSWLASWAACPGS